ncbi:uncharacterized protein [Rutidosis leptorrhynchoides]|uniref:uncharacterized protein n=1 Tax=Rutidosis leptorrhynchoides TaxID=125765 RepID=UPI003A99C34C
MPIESYKEYFRNHLIIDELSYDKSTLINQHSDFITKLTSEQKDAYDQIMKAVDQSKEGVFFLYGYGGTGKTFLWKTLSAALRSKGEIVLNVASSGIASLLLSGGRTAHSRFHIPLHPTDESFYTISPSRKLGELIRRTKLFIWDEAPMRQLVGVFESNERKEEKETEQHSDEQLKKTQTLIKVSGRF